MIFGRCPPSPSSYQSILLSQFSLLQLSPSANDPKLQLIPCFCFRQIPLFSRLLYRVPALGKVYDPSSGHLPPIFYLYSLSVDRICYPSTTFPSAQADIYFRLVWPPHHAPLFFTHFPSVSTMLKSHERRSFSPTMFPVALAVFQSWNALIDKQ